MINRVLYKGVMDTISDLQIPYEDMLASGMHFGRKKTVFNPRMEPYVYTVRDGICIIDLLKTQTQLKNTAEFLKKTIQNGGLVLFVALTKQSTESVKELAISLNQPYVVDRWIGGTLTNFKVINARVKKLEEMEKDLKESELPVHEAKLAKVNIVAITNTDADPNQVNYAIPANDRSKKSVDLIIDALNKELTNVTNIS